MYIALSGAGPGPSGGRAEQGPPADEADLLYAQREDLSSAARAAAIWAGRLAADPGDFESAWKLARARYWLGRRLPRQEARRALEAGIEAARTAERIAPDRPEGHFWAAATMGALAESFGVGQGLRYRGRIRDALRRVLEIDPGFQKGSADRALGRWYYLVPRLFGGSKERSEQHLRRSLEYAPDSTISRFFLAETLIALGRPEQARAELRKVLDAPIDPEWAPEDREYKDRARKLLESF